ncbi:MAG: BolA/IbaG family iron-sulfur metabolism protein [Rhodospirillales bacterium]|nr:BolA/IbaG family iron-sulfur metabolism protein [Rhodospirillales bacterium]
MIIQQTIEEKLHRELTPAHLEVLNESHMHNVPPGSETHFKVVVVSDLFQGESRVHRHQRINAILADELAGEVHALALQPLTADEWQEKGGVTAASPQCHDGGSA